MVFRRSRGNALRPVHRIKHVVDSQFGTTVGTQVDTDVIIAVDAPVVTSTGQVETASTVHGIYLKVEAYSRSDAALANYYLIVFKNPGGNLTIPTANAVGSNDNKKYVIHQEMVMLQRAINGNPRVVFQGVIAIPRSYKRFGINDKLTIGVLSPGVVTDSCIEVIYKEFR